MGICFHDKVETLVCKIKTDTARNEARNTIKKTEINMNTNAKLEEFGEIENVHSTLGFVLV